jgi:hypothetical protein
MAVGCAPVTAGVIDTTGGTSGAGRWAACGIVGWEAGAAQGGRGVTATGAGPGADDPALMFTTRTAPQLAQVMWLEALVAWQFPHCHGAAVAMMALLPARRLGEGYRRVGDGFSVATGPVGAEGSVVGCFAGAAGSDEAGVVGGAGVRVVVLGVADGVVLGVADGLGELGELVGVEVDAVLAGAPPDG